MEEVKIFLINELTIWRFLYLYATNASPYVLAVDTLLPPLQNTLSWVVGKLISTHRARWIVDLCSAEEKFLWECPTRTILHDVFGRTECWHNSFFQFDRIDSVVPDYAYGYKKITCNYMKQRHFELLLMIAMIKSKGEKNLRFFGVQDHTVGLFESFTDQIPACLNPRNFSVNYIINFCVFVSAVLVGIIWTISRIRLFVPKPKRIFFAADFYSDHRDFPLYDEMLDGGEVLLVPRNRLQQTGLYDELAKFPSCFSNKGCFSLGQAFSCIAMIICDAYAIGLTTFRCTPPVFFQAILMPFRRAVLRAFFSLYRPRYFWGRDDYNVEHILRRQELNRVGGTSLGLCHGFPVSARVFPMLRHVSFDVYFMNGLAVYEKYLKPLWPEDMIVKAIGSFEIQLRKNRNSLAETEKDILIMAGISLGYPTTVAFVRDVATAFPDRKILLQIKSIWDGSETKEAFVDDCTSGLNNVSLVSGEIYELFRKVRYVFSDPSTVIVEALEFGRITMMFDVLDFHRHCIYREYDGLCVKTGAEAVKRIISIEEGTETYQLEDYASLTNMTDQSYLEIVRELVGLPSKVEILSEPLATKPAS